MESTVHGRECVDQSEETQIPLISGVPDDIASFCLASVPREYHMAMKCVSRRWRDFLCSEELCAHRRKYNLAESWIYALCREKSGCVFLYVLNPSSSRRLWKRMHEFPPHISRREGMGFAALGKRLFVLGGCGWSEDAAGEAYCYDAAMNSWLQFPPLSTERCYFACETLDGKIMAVGGLGLKPNVPQTWDIYDPSTKTCKTYSDTNIVPIIEDSFVMDGKIYVRSGGWSSTTSDVHAAVYNASSGTWKHMDDDMASGWLGPAVVAADDLYVLDRSFGATLTMWCKKTRTWIRLGKLSQLVMKQPCRLVSIGSSVFVIGKDCSTVVIDVENARKTMNGVMVCSSIPKTWDDDIDVISCKSMAI